jgi:hypothetical protein
MSVTRANSTQLLNVNNSPDIQNLQHESRIFLTKLSHHLNLSNFKLQVFLFFPVRLTLLFQLNEQQPTRCTVYLQFIELSRHYMFRAYQQSIIRRQNVYMWQTVHVLIGIREIRQTQLKIYYYMHYIVCGPGSSVGIPTDYGLDGSGSDSR